MAGSAPMSNWARRPEDNPKPKRASLPKGWSAEAMDIEQALKLLSLPRMVGAHPEDGAPVEAAIGRFGPYVSYKAKEAAKPLYANLPEVDEVWTIGMNRAVELLAAKAAGRSGRGSAAAPLKELGEHPEHGGPVQVMAGRYGPYVKWDKVNATLPKDVEPGALSLEQAVELIAEKAAKGGKGKAKAKAPAKAKAAAKPKAAASRRLRQSRKRSPRPKPPRKRPDGCTERPKNARFSGRRTRVFRPPLQTAAFPLDRPARAMT